MKRKSLSNWLDKKIIGMRTFLVRKSEAMGTVEIILIIVVLIGLVLIFKEQITNVVEDIFKKITKQTGKV